MKLTDRLEKIASLVSEGAIVADIGTDHGYIPVYLLENGIIEKSILSDINRGPLENAKEEVNRKKLSNKADLRLGGGVSVLNPGEADEIIIAGMGGILIAEIIEEGLEVCSRVNKLILQPMQASEELRKYLLNNNFEIINEHLVNEDFRIYEIIEATYNENIETGIDEIYYEVPKILVEKKEPLLKKMVSKKISECDSILEKIGSINNESTNKRKTDIKERKENLSKILRNMEG